MSQRCPGGLKRCLGAWWATPARLLVLEGIFGEYFFFRTCLALSAVLPLQCPCSGLTCFAMMAEEKLRCCSWDPAQAARGHGAASPADLTAQSFPCPLHLLPTSSIPSLFNADYRAGSCQEMPCFKCFPPTQKLQERFFREREKKALGSIILGRN